MWRLIVCENVLIEKSSVQVSTSYEVDRWTLFIYRK
nr:MAG TPA: hypothetical protein [Caudoviricetes sp.]